MYFMANPPITVDRIGTGMHHTYATITVVESIAPGAIGSLHSFLGSLVQVLGAWVASYDAKAN
jgi:hypothetical protein